MKKAYTPKTPRAVATNKEPLQVYCRLKPISPNEPSCITLVSDTTVRLSVQDAANNLKSCKEYTFKRVFSDVTSQKDIFDEVALPLVEQLVSGKNGLLFTYGVTGSGKTYTMTGSKQNVGIMPRCLDVLFNSINDFQAKKYIFIPDRMNGFEVQTDEEAETHRRKLSRNVGLRKKESQEDLLSARSKDDIRVAIPEEDNAFAVFVSYVELYNNAVYDLLDNPSDAPIGSRPQSKLIREDASGSMYIHGVTEVEVKSTEEAFEMFYKGQKRKRMAHTNLNINSSRSHAVFTIRLVQAPLDIQGETVMQDKQMICVSQLSLVDLAGSERTNRTNNTGQRLGEASKINQSLMALRKCFETLRKNQQNPTAQMMVPYRENKITHLFKNFFEGDGDCRMIVCVNPSIGDADENILVMQFAEASQDIMVKPTPMKADYNIGLTPGRRRANQAYKKALQMLEEVKEQEPLSYIPHDANIIYHFEPFPTLEDCENEEEYRKKLVNILTERKNKVELYKKDIAERTSNFRTKLVKILEDNNILKRELDAQKALADSYQAKMENLERRATSSDSAVASYKRKYEEISEEVKKLRRENEFKENKIRQYDAEIKRKRYQREPSEFPHEKHDKRTPAPLSEDVSNQNHVASTYENSRSTVVSNPRHGKTCDSHDQWLDHRPTLVTPLNTVLQPVMRKRKSFDKITSPKEVRKTSKYCLMTQNQDETGDVETQFYKGDVVPTAGGGAQIIFNDVETLKQSSPVTSPKSPKPTSLVGLYPDVKGRCATALEGHRL